MSEPIRLTWQAFSDVVDHAAVVARQRECTEVWGIPQGGCVLAATIAERTGLKMRETPPDKFEPSLLIVDDIVDSGKTLRAFAEYSPNFFVWVQKDTCGGSKTGADLNVEWYSRFRADSWVVFPWEGKSAGPEDAVIRLLEFVGEDPNRNGLADTPARVLAAYRELCRGYGQDPSEPLGRVFTQDAGQVYDGMVILRDVELYSLCEHHLLPFQGRCHVAYIPGEAGLIVGISKLARVIDIFARRLQVQERLTIQIANALEEHLKPLGVAVMIDAEHLCMRMRGVGKQNSRMITSHVSGIFKEDAKARSEALALLRGE